MSTTYYWQTKAFHKHQQHASSLECWLARWCLPHFPAPPDSLPPGIKVKANLAFDNDSSPLSDRKLLL